jgi:DNA-nicking Smr family endonuclease
LIAGKDDDDSKGFADLIGTTRPLTHGPDRIDPVRRKTIRTPRRSGSHDRAFRWPDPEERLRAASHGVSDARLQALDRGDPEPEERIDLHGLRREPAARRLADRIASARQRGLRCVLVIHGRGQRSAGGEAVLRDALPDWLSTGRSAKNVLAFAPAPIRLGGEGATLVLLRRT